jgi:hypothetical protein
MPSLTSVKIFNLLKQRTHAKVTDARLWLHYDERKKIAGKEITLK